MRRILFVLCVTAVIAVARPVWAHHSAVTKYDPKKPTTMTGTVTTVEWANPHIYFYIDVKDSSGKTINWAVEGAPPNVLYRRGWKKDSLKPGDVVTVEGLLPRIDGVHDLNGRSVTLADGRKIFSGSPDGLPERAQ